MSDQIAAPQHLPVNIEDEMKRSYMDYAMSVIIGRALPDARDGLKPAHRRVLYGMKTMGLSSSRGYRKCAKIVGEVMGNFHPHGDASIYDTLVRLAQDFNMRYPLVDGQGNFGSIDGDPAAAMRYTEARLKSLADDMMSDLDKETVDFTPNYDETTEEPTVLPTPFPNLLVNGSAGIAVGMATNVPPHNLTEVLDGCIWIIENTYLSTNPDAPRLTSIEKLRQLVRIVTGPDFPTGGYIVGRGGIMQAYTTGRGSILMRARSTTETNKKGDRLAIVFTEIPYQVNKARLIERIADLVRDKIIEGISDLRDESDRDGMRIVVELKRGEMPEVVLNNLYKHTPLQSTFGINTLAIVGGRPKVMNLLELIETFVEFRREIVRRRTEYELRKAEARYHILEGLRIALDNLDAVITLIRGSKTVMEAREGLMSNFGLSQLQSQAILDMQLQRLTGLERQKILDELADLLGVIERLRAILASQRLLMQIIVDELKTVKENYGDERRTEIIEGEAGDISIEDLITEEDMAITVSNTGYIKRTAITEYRTQTRGGKGRIGMRTKEEDFVSHLFVASTHAYILIFSDKGRMYWLKVHEIPESTGGKGKSIANLVSMEAGERIAAMLATKTFDDDKFIMMGTRRGVVKKTPLSAFSNVRTGGIIAMGVEEGDSVIAVQLTDGSSHVLIGTRNGIAIRFKEEDVRSMGRTAYGVRGVTLRDDDYVVGMEAVKSGGSILTVTEHGYGKRTDVDEYRTTGRGGVGIINIDTSERNGLVVAVAYVELSDEVLLVTQQGMMIRTPADTIRLTGRAAQGVRLINIEDDDRVVGLAKLNEKAAETAAETAVESVDTPADVASAEPSAEPSSDTEPDGGDDVA